MGIWSITLNGVWPYRAFPSIDLPDLRGTKTTRGCDLREHVDWPSEELVHISMVENFWHIWETTTSRIQKKYSIFFFTQTSTKCKAKARSKDTLKLEWKKLPIHVWNAPKIHLGNSSKKMRKIYHLPAIIPSTNGSPHICQTRVGRWHVESCTTHLGSHVCHLRDEFPSHWGLH